LRRERNRLVWNQVALLLGLTISARFGQAQTTSTIANPPGKMAFILPSILDAAVAAAPAGLQPVLRAAIEPRWVSLNSSVAVELANLPNPTLASGLNFTWDPDSGTFRSRPQSFGPILTERAETIGKGKVLVAISNQNFSFDRLDDLDLRGFEVAYPLGIPLSAIIPGASSSTTIQGLIVADAYINVHVNETIAHVTYGLTHWLDVSYALSIVDSSTTVRGGATLRELTTGTTLTTLPTQLVQISSTGIGDGVLRFKANLSSWPPKRGVANKTDPQNRKLKFAVGIDLRIPTGDEFNYHGAGAFGVKPFVVASLNNPKLSPHVNAGFLWNGKSYLASQYPTEARHLPGQLTYAVGFDSALTPKITLAFDILDQMVISGQRSLLKPFDAGGTSYSQIYFDDITRNEFNASAGVKAQIVNGLVATANLMFRLNSSGLRARVVPLLGISYQF
jgi:hypothetical protein